jgi:UDP-2,4-diacetamido-2,4,6-trideoxy-beta-L-altropyranose hydrolase
MKMQSLLIIRADATPEIGTGHLMRCLALAHAWRTRVGEVIFVSCCQSRDLRQRMATVARQVVAIERAHPDPGDWKKTSQILDAQNDAWVVLDGYHFDDGYHKKIRAPGKRLLVVDDMAHLDRYEADIVLNQNIDAESLPYATASFTRLFLGTRFILLRPEFGNRVTGEPKVPRLANRLLVTLGGGDPGNMTLRVMQALEKIDIDGFEAIVVVGSTNPHLRQIRAEGSRSSVPVRVVDNVHNMAELMAWADLAVSAGGSTCWELAYMGVPTLAVTMADNQLAVVNGLEKAGVVENLGWHHELSSAKIAWAVKNLAVDADKRAQMQQRGRDLVDGNGLQRVLTGMERYD